MKIVIFDDILKYEFVDLVSNEDFWLLFIVMKLYIRELFLGNCWFIIYNVEWFGIKNCMFEIVLEFEV